MTAPVIYWYRRDLRLDDLPGLQAAAAQGKVIPCFVLDDDSPGAWAPGTASRWWLHHSLASLEAAFSALGSQLVVLRGDTAETLASLARTTGASAVFCSERYEPWGRQTDQLTRELLQQQDVEMHTYPGISLVHPEALRRPDGGIYKVYTPFWRRLRQCKIATPLPAPAASSFHDGGLRSLASNKWNLIVGDQEYNAAMTQPWEPGEAGAQRRLQMFLERHVKHYDAQRNLPAEDACSRLSPHLHFGEVSPQQVWHAAACLGPEAEGFLSEVAWREFNYHQLYAHPTMPEVALREPFRTFPWSPREDLFDAWRAGQTGYPLVDAGMRELAATGFMHNRVRMVAASFLCKHLLIPWQWGARWFWDQLVDADLANNSGGWQWVAGCGLDAAPYFRVFNPMLQSEKFDGAGAYLRKWVPELRELDNKQIHKPWTAPLLAPDYPPPIVDHSDARAAALAAWDTIRQSA
ncbi:hypothetical protein A3709_17285 [Halioglobus sp. HI00S01]|uniref:cryptochrome/photolyase family protein n=1 Tax=Halioglobus sp. HI00S01 TaxID=1822214 RepID=UPI0007C24335|nr:deoxyribodipyrimidine photo-lyase [Halioglobus sp. HI00S01]KZX58751.1 hypothetical protein A3709_17285 [Halioglobus sp. HI00S01]